MLHFYHSNRMEWLAGQLTELAGRPSEGDPFHAETLVVQNRGMARWLSLNLADANGIAANLDFKFISEIMFDLYRAQYEYGEGEELPRRLPTDKDVMAWSFMALLDRLGEDPVFQPLRSYLEAGDGEEPAFRRWKLAWRLADIYDQYLIYRPAMIGRWEEGEVKEEEAWQGALWKRLMQYQAEGGASLPHRAGLQRDLMKSLQDGSFPIGELPDRLIIFGISSLPPAQLQVFVRLAGIIDVHIFALVPRPAGEWIEAGEPENALLASLGKQGREFIQLLFETAHNEGLMQQGAFRQTSQYRSSETSLLESIRGDMVADEVIGLPQEPGEKPYPIQIHSCHSERREMEVLRDRLLDLLDRDPSLSPSDIVVMTPDIEPYVPVIDAVFGTSGQEKGIPRLPYTVADRGVKAEHAAIELYLKLLGLGESRFKVTEVMDLLDAEPLRRKFEISDEDLHQLQRWLEDTKVRWGIDAGDRAGEQQPRSDRFTWIFGLNRMWTGSAIHAGDEHLFQNILPYDEIEGMEQVELLGRFSRLLHSLFKIKRDAGSPRRPDAWIDLLSSWARQLLPDDDEIFDAVQYIRDELQGLRKKLDLAAFSQPVSLRIMQSYLDQALSDTGKAGGFMGRGITFCSMVPMRSIPFRVVAMVGLNDGTYPRRDQSAGFDLMAGAHKTGDRSRRDEDRYLFLEGLLSVRDQLILTFKGRSLRDNRNIPPSVIISEFRHYLQDRFAGDVAPVVNHPLQAFSSRYFKTESQEERLLFSYSKEQCALSRIVHQPPESGDKPDPLPEAESEWQQVDLEDLIRFWQHPSRYFYEQRLELRYEDVHILTEDREPFEVKGLDAYRIGGDLLQRLMNLDVMAEVEHGDHELVQLSRVLAEARGWLPAGRPGELEFERSAGQALRYTHELKDWLQAKGIAGEAEKMDVQLQIGDFQLSGHIGNHFPSLGLFDYRYSRYNPAHLIPLWIRLLSTALLDAGPSVDSAYLAARHKKSGTLEIHRVMVPDQPESIMQQLLNGYWEGLKSPLPFLPKCSRIYAEEQEKGSDMESRLKAASDRWIDRYDFNSEGEDPYYQRAFGSEGPFDYPEFGRWAEHIWLPVLQHEEKA